jgi:hypothetical protein
MKAARFPEILLHFLPGYTDLHSGRLVFSTTKTEFLVINIRKNGAASGK